MREEKQEERGEEGKGIERMDLRLSYHNRV
jgi:hypothetical protein